MKFKIIAAVVVVIVVLLAIIIGAGLRNSSSTEGDPQTEQVQPQQ
jgi:hypothetical protein